MQSKHLVFLSSQFPLDLQSSNDYIPFLIRLFQTCLLVLVLVRLLSYFCIPISRYGSFLLCSGTGGDKGDRDKGKRERGGLRYNFRLHSWWCKKRCREPTVIVGVSFLSLFLFLSLSFLFFKKQELIACLSSAHIPSYPCPTLCAGRVTQCDNVQTRLNRATIACEMRGGRVRLVLEREMPKVTLRTRTRSCEVKWSGGGGGGGMAKAQIKSTSKQSEQFSELQSTSPNATKLNEFQEEFKPFDSRMMPRNRTCNTPSCIKCGNKKIQFTAVGYAPISFCQRESRAFVAHLLLVNSRVDYVYVPTCTYVRT